MRALGISKDVSSYRTKIAIAATVLGTSAALGLALAESGSATLAQSAAKLKQGKIVFVHYDGNDDEIYVMNANGGGARPLTDNDIDDRGPSFSGNGKRIAFTSSRDGGGDDDIFVMKANGSDETQVTTGPAADDDDYGAAFSPDGKRIAFVSTRDDADNHIFIMRASGSDVRQLTSGVAELGPKFSPNGQQIVYMDFAGVDGEIAVMKANGDGQHAVTDNDFDDRAPEFSADGKRILFSSFRDDSYEVFTMKRNGNGQSPLTDGGEFEDSTGPSTTLDGRNRILFHRDVDFLDNEIMSMKANGSDVQPLTDNDIDDRAPDPVPTLECAGKKATIIGTNKSEKLKGGPSKDVIAGLGGKDKLIGAGKKDVLCGGKGKDKLDGGLGKDVCDGGPAEDKAKGCTKLKAIP
jgi:Tol biopolymer transport system component